MINKTIRQGLVLFFLVLTLVSSVKAVSVSHTATAIYNRANKEKGE